MVNIYWKIHINDSNILNNVSDDFTWNPSKLEENKVFPYRLDIKYAPVSFYLNRKKLGTARDLLLTCWRLD